VTVTRSTLSALVLATLLVVTGVAAPVHGDRGDFGDESSTVQYGRDRTVDVQHYLLNVTFDPERREVRGSVSVSMSALNDGLTAIELDAGPMEIEAVSIYDVENPRALPFNHDGETLRVELPRALVEGESVTLDVSYAARPKSGLYFVGPDADYPDRPSQVWSQGESEDNHHWFPSVDFPNDRATSEERYTVPAHWTAIGNGELIDERDNGDGTRTFHYRMNVPHVSYLISVVAGEFERYAEDFDGIPVEYYVPRGTGKETALRSFGTTVDMLEFFSERTGVRYPYDKYAQSCAIDFIYGGMENISATTQTAETLHDERAALETDSWGLVAHEAAHQWFGDLLTCANWSHAWLNEGFATYWENLWREHYQGRDEFLYRMLQDRDSYLAEDREDYRRPIVEYRYTDPMDLFDAHLYPKGAWVLHMIRGVLGDELFFKAMRHYTRTFREQVVETHDLRRAIAASTGVDLERFFDQWLYHGGHPELKVSRRWDADEQVLRLRVDQIQTVDAMTPLFRLPLRVAVDTDSGTVLQTLHLERASQDLTLRLESEPRLVRIDPEHSVLFELEHERPVAEMLLALERDPNPVGRIFAARDLARAASADRAADGLAEALRGDPFYGVRLEAAKALGSVRGDRAEAALLEGLGDPDARVRTAAAQALGRFRGSDRAALALGGVIDDEPAYGTVAAAVFSLAEIRAEAAREAALRALTLDSYREQIRVAGLRALAELKDPEALPTVRAWTEYGKPPAARRAAIAALARLSRGEAERDEAARRLVDLLDDPYIWARSEAMKALASLGVDEARDRLARSARVETDSRLRRQARRAIREIEEGNAGSRDVDALAAEVERLREETRHQAGRIDELEKQSR
jgi:aminopeptidase N